MSIKMFNDSIYDFFIDSVQMKFDDSVNPDGLVKIEIKDSFKVEKENDKVKVVVIREIFDEKNVINLKVQGHEIKNLKDSNCSEEEVTEYLNNNLNELIMSFTQLSIVITNNTLFTPFRGMVTPPQFLKKN